MTYRARFGMTNGSLRSGEVHMGQFVTLEVADGIGTIRLNRPPVNALNDKLTAELADAARAAEARTRSAR